jgi:Zn-dependent protease
VSPEYGFDLAASCRDIDNQKRRLRPVLKEAPVNPVAPSQSPFSLRWRVFGIGFSVQISFWIINLIFGFFYVPELPGGREHLWAYLGLWLVCAFFSILIHELGHSTTARLFGVRTDIVLHSMGGMAVGNFDRLQPWQRIVVSAAGPVFGLALFAILNYPVQRLANAWDVNLPINPWYWALVHPVKLFEEGRIIDSAGLPGILIIMNLVWNVFNLIPIIPLDGGMIMREVVTAVLPRQGMRLAYGFSFLISGAIAVYSLIAYIRPGVPYPPIHPAFSALMFGLMAFDSFSTLRALEAESAPRRYRDRDYEERDW